MKIRFLIGIMSIAMFAAVAHAQTVGTQPSTQDKIAAIRAQIAQLQVQLDVLSAQSNQSTSVSSGIIINSNLSVGSQSEDVTKLQGYLIKTGYLNLKTGVPTGYYGQQTAEAVKKMQANNGLEVVGTVGPKTRSIIANVSSPEVSNNVVTITPSPVTPVIVVTPLTPAITPVPITPPVTTQPQVTTPVPVTLPVITPSPVITPTPPAVLVSAPATTPAVTPVVSNLTVSNQTGLLWQPNWASNPNLCHNKNDLNKSTSYGTCVKDNGLISIVDANGVTINDPDNVGQPLLAGASEYCDYLNASGVGFSAGSDGRGIKYWHLPSRDEFKSASTLTNGMPNLYGGTNSPLPSGNLSSYGVWTSGTTTFGGAISAEAAYYFQLQTGWESWVQSALKLSPTGASDIMCVHTR